MSALSITHRTENTVLMCGLHLCVCVCVCVCVSAADGDGNLRSLGLHCCPGISAVRVQHRGYQCPSEGKNTKHGSMKRKAVTEVLM